MATVTKRRNITALAVCGLSAFASATMANAYTSASYVQDGLIAQWDGIDNAGTGVHNPGAKIWKDLAGNYDLTLLPKGGWSEEGNALVVNGAAAVCSNALPAYSTIEVVYKMKKPDGHILFNSGTDPIGAFRFVVFNRDNETSGTTGYFSGALNIASPHVVWDSFDPAAIRSMSATYGAADVWGGVNVLSVYANGVARNDGSAASSWGTGDGHIMIGDRAEAGAYPWFGEVYTIRIYSRALSAAEIAQNYAIDVARFMAPAQEEEYVTDGLVARWDGIDNAGTGTHNPSATVWKDLAGNLDLTLGGSSGWAGGKAFKINARGGYAYNDNRAPNYKTIEVVFKVTDVSGRIIFDSGFGNRLCAMDGKDSSGNLTAKVYFDGSNVATPCIDQPCNYYETCFLSARYDDNGAVSDLWRDGEGRTDLMYTQNWGDVGSKMTIGWIYGKSYGYWMGEIYAIRLYDRKLTKWELAHNNRIDRKRFLTSGSYIQRGLAQQWDGIDNAGAGVHDSTATTWKNLVSGGLDLTLKASSKWTDNALACLGTGLAAQNESNHLYFETVEIAFRNRKPDASFMLFSGGSEINRYCGIGANYTMWTYRHASRDFTRASTDPVSLTWVSSQNVYADGTPIRFETVEDQWNAGTDTIQVGDRASGTSYPFTGDIYAIRTYYSTLLKAYEIAYNAKVDDARFFMPKGGQSLTWKGPDGALSDGLFGSNGCWKVTDRPRSRAIPTIGDRVSMPAGNYTVTLDEQTWSLGSLSMGAGAKLALALPSGAWDAAKPLVSISGGIAADSTAELVLDNAAAFCASHGSWDFTLVKCGQDSTAALRNLADGLNATLPVGKVRVVDGNSLVYTSPKGFVMIVK